VNRRTDGVLRGGHSPDIGKATQFKQGNPGGGRPRKTPITEIFEELLADPETRSLVRGFQLMIVSVLRPRSSGKNLVRRRECASV
jgi:hypothetical protein